MVSNDKPANKAKAGPGAEVTKVKFPSFEREESDRKLLAGVQQRAAEIERVAYEKGFSKGETVGIEMGLAKAMPTVEALARLVENLDQMARQTLAEMEPKIVQLVLAIAERVILTTIAADDTVVQRVVQAALREVDERWEVTVRVNPGEYEFLQQHKDQWLRIEQADKVTLTSDPNIESGGCIVQSPQIFIDATLAKALERVAQVTE